MTEKITNANFLLPTGFKITISRENYPHLSYFAQSVQHPSLELSATEMGFRRIQNVPVLGDAVINGSLALDIILDENMESYKEIYDWMMRMVNEKHAPTSRKFSSQFGDQPIPTSYCDVVVSVLTSANNSNKKIVYKNAFPTSLGDVQFNSQASGDYITYPVTFRFDYFEFS